MKIRFLFLAPTFLGKSTAHANQLAIDPEALPSFTAIKLTPDTEGAPLPEDWHRAASREYAVAVRAACASPAQFVAVHPSPNLWSELADGAFDGRLIINLVPSDAAINRAFWHMALEKKANRSHAPARAAAFELGYQLARDFEDLGVYTLVTESVTFAVAEALQLLKDDPIGFVDHLTASNDLLALGPPDPNWKLAAAADDVPPTEAELARLRAAATASDGGSKT